MTAAVLTSTLTGGASSPKFSLLARIFVSALAESRARCAARELRRHEAFLADLGRRQDHSPGFLTQDNFLPAKI